MKRSGDGWSGWVDYTAPVIGEGMVDGKRWSFYARGEAWGLQIAAVADEDPEAVGIQTSGWIVEGTVPGRYAASHMSPGEAWALIEAAFEQLRRGELVLVQPAHPQEEKQRHRPGGETKARSVATGNRPSRIVDCNAVGVCIALGSPSAGVDVGSCSHAGNGGGDSRHTAGPGADEWKRCRRRRPVSRLGRGDIHSIMGHMVDHYAHSSPSLSGYDQRARPPWFFLAMLPAR